MKISELVGSELYLAELGDNCKNLAERLNALDVHALLVVDDDHTPVGIVSSSDLTPDLSETMTVGEIMTDQIYTIDTNQEAKEAARMMRDRGVHHLVVNQGEEAIGMLSSFDLLRVIEECL